MIGSVFERRSTTNTDVPLCSHHSRFTDDTVRTVATAYAILDAVPDRGDIVWLEFDPQAGRKQRCSNDHATGAAAQCTECSTCDIETGSSHSAARKAALRAMLRMLPPVALSRASLPWSMPTVGVRAGNAPRQIASRIA